MGCAAYGREPAGLARPATSFHLLAQMKGGKAKCLNASPFDRIAWLESSVDGEHLGSITGSAIPEDLQRNESDSARRVRTLKHQPNLLAEALGSDRWRSGTLLW
jgi:hypothetical protein